MSASTLALHGRALACFGKEKKCFPLCVQQRRVATRLPAFLHLLLPRPESFCSSLPFIQRRCVWVCVGVVAALILIICHKEAGSPQVAVRKTSGSHALTCGCGRTVDSSGGSRARSRSRRQTRRPLPNRSHLPMGRLHAPLLDMQSKQGNHSSQRTAPNCS